MENNNKMLDVILSKIDGIVQDLNFNHSHYEPDFLPDLGILLCIFLIEGTNENELGHVIERLNNAQNALKQIHFFDEDEKREVSRFMKEIQNTTKSMEQRQEALDLLQEGYSGSKCIP